MGNAYREDGTKDPKETTAAVALQVWDGAIKTQHITKRVRVIRLPDETHVLEIHEGNDALGADIWRRATLISSA